MNDRREAQRVAVIGTGAMGGGVVQSLVRLGVGTIARDIRPDAQARAVAHGASGAASAAMAAREADAVIVLVVDAEEVESVLFDSDGVAGAMQRDGIVIVSSTVDPAYVAALVPRLASAGLRLLDAPVSGGPAKAAAGTMSMMLSGDAQARARVHRILSGITGALFTISDRVGDAATVKVVNNLLAGANLAAAAEAMAIARTAGLDSRRVAEVIDASSGASWIFHDRLPACSRTISRRGRRCDCSTRTSGSHAQWRSDWASRRLSPRPRKTRSRKPSARVTPKTTTRHCSCLAAGEHHRFALSISR